MCLNKQQKIQHKTFTISLPAAIETAGIQKTTPDFKVIITLQKQNRPERKPLINSVPQTHFSFSTDKCFFHCTKETSCLIIGMLPEILAK